MSQPEIIYGDSSQQGFGGGYEGQELSLPGFGDLLEGAEDEGQQRVEEGQEVRETTNSFIEDFIPPPVDLFENVTEEEEGEKSKGEKKKKGPKPKKGTPEDEKKEKKKKDPKPKKNARENGEEVTTVEIGGVKVMRVFSKLGTSARTVSKKSTSVLSKDPQAGNFRPSISEALNTELVENLSNKPYLCRYFFPGNRWDSNRSLHMLFEYGEEQEELEMPRDFRPPFTTSLNCAYTGTLVSRTPKEKPPADTVTLESKGIFLQGKNVQSFYVAQNKDGKPFSEWWSNLHAYRVKEDSCGLPILAVFPDVLGSDVVYVRFYPMNVLEYATYVTKEKQKYESMQRECVASTKINLKKQYFVKNSLQNYISSEVTDAILSAPLGWVHGGIVVPNIRFDLDGRAKLCGFQHMDKDTKGMERTMKDPFGADYHPYFHLYPSRMATTSYAQETERPGRLFNQLGQELDLGMLHTLCDRDLTAFQRRIDAVDSGGEWLSRGLLPAYDSATGEIKPMAEQRRKFSGPLNAVQVTNHKTNQVTTEVITRNRPTTKYVFPLSEEGEEQEQRFKKPRQFVDGWRFLLKNEHAPYFAIDESQRPQWRAVEYLIRAQGAPNVIPWKGFYRKGDELCILTEDGQGKIEHGDTISLESALDAIEAFHFLSEQKDIYFREPLTFRSFRLSLSSRLYFADFSGACDLSETASGNPVTERKLELGVILYVLLGGRSQASQEAILRGEIPKGESHSIQAMAQRLLLE